MAGALQGEIKEEIVLMNLRFESGYLVFPGKENPKDMEGVIEYLRSLGFILGTRTFIADAILENRVAEVMPGAIFILLVAQNDICGYAFQAYPVFSPRSSQDIIEKTYAGGQFENAEFMYIDLLSSNIRSIIYS